MILFIIHDFVSYCKGIADSSQDIILFFCVIPSSKYHPPAKLVPPLINKRAHPIPILATRILLKSASY